MYLNASAFSLIKEACVIPRSTETTPDHSPKGRKPPQDCSSLDAPPSCMAGTSAGICHSKVVDSRPHYGATSKSPSSSSRAAMIPFHCWPCTGIEISCRPKALSQARILRKRLHPRVRLSFSLSARLDRHFILWLRSRYRTGSGASWCYRPLDFGGWHPVMGWKRQGVAALSARGGLVLLR